jgi:CheY-like chemotaxis protein
MSEDPRTVLLVERSREARDRIGRWLEEEGYEVLDCPGPTGPEYRCVAGRTGRCPLVHGADAVVIDLWLESDAVLEGTSAIDLLGYYLGSGLPVVALTHAEEAVRLFCEENLATLPWPPDRREVVETVGAIRHPGSQRDGESNGGSPSDRAVDCEVGAKRLRSFG